MVNKYAMAIITRGRRFYWSAQIAGWSVWLDATHYTEESRKKTKLIKGAFWVSVLRGMGDNPYPADSVLSDPTPEYLASLPKPKLYTSDPKPVPLLRKRGGAIHTPELPRTRTDTKKVKPHGGGRKRS